MLELITAICALILPAEPVERLRRTAPTYLTSETAREHMAAAAVAASMTGTDAALLLSIAHHESRYTVNAISPESGKRVSCGVLTPEPVSRCEPSSLPQNYLTGARHLKTWISATPNMRTALLGYAGGWRLIKFCADGGQARGCHAPDVFMFRARLIQAKAKQKPAKPLW